jgi:HD-GYP domain-containing protein (c-di-GMP phosphodiesterase class II)
VPGVDNVRLKGEHSGVGSAQAVTRYASKRSFELSVAGGVLWLTFYASWLAFGPSSAHARLVFGNTVYLVPIAAAALLAGLAWRRSDPAARPFWALVALSNAIWLAAEALWAVRQLTRGTVPFPWWTDVGYLASYVLLIPALVTARRPSVRAERLGAFADALLVTGSMAFLWWLFILRPLPIGSDLASLASLAYPLLGLVLLGLVVALELLPARPSRTTFAFFTAAVVATAVTDGLYTSAVLTNTYVSGAWLDLGWQLEAVLLSLTAVSAIAQLNVARVDEFLRRPRRLNPVVPAGMALAVAIGTLAAESAHHRVSRGVLLGCLLLTTFVTGRLALMLRDARRHSGLREPETGLYTPAYFADQLSRRLAQLRYYGEPFSVLLVGHDDPGADRAAVAKRTQSALRDVDSVCRIDDGTTGVLMPLVSREEARTLAEYVRFAVGAGRSTVSIGVASILEPATPDQVLDRARGALVAARRLGGNQVRTASDDRVLFAHGALEDEAISLLAGFAQMVDRRENELGDESSRVMTLAEALGSRLGLGPQGATRVGLAGLLHDLGKVELPDRVLQKAAPLDADEWSRVRAHPRRGAEIIKAIDSLRELAPVIAAHHEHWDGTGYPDGLNADAIPLEARIVAVADAYISMLSPRAYRGPLSELNTKKEFLQESGRQFDPTVVHALFELLADHSQRDLFAAHPDSALLAKS